MEHLLHIVKLELETCPMLILKTQKLTAHRVTVYGLNVIFPMNATFIHQTVTKIATLEIKLLKKLSILNTVSTSLVRV